jgi:hypothetical protein
VLVTLKTAAAITAVGGFASTVAETAGPLQPVLWTAGVLTAVGVIYRFFHVGEIVRGILNFLRDYHGEPARPGVEARPGLPERLARIESQTGEIKGRDLQLLTELKRLARSADDNGEKIDRLDERVITLDERVTDHRRRNEEQAAVLRAELERRATELEARLQERNSNLDARLDRISDDLLRAEAMRAALTELGLDITPPTPPQ